MLSTLSKSQGKCHSARFAERRERPRRLLSLLVGKVGRYPDACRVNLVREGLNLIAPLQSQGPRFAINRPDGIQPEDARTPTSAATEPADENTYHEREDEREHDGTDGTGDEQTAQTIGRRADRCGATGGGGAVRCCGWKGGHRG